MSFNRYYQSELNALRQLGRRFCERNPALAPFLGDSGRDPDVERLLEGFAFLTGRLRQKLDDQLPELSHSLMHLLWLNYMRPLPAFSMLQFAPLLRAGPAVTVERDTPVESVAIDGERCRFRTCYATDVLPLQISALDYSAQGEGALLSLRLEMTAEGHMGELVLEHLRLHFAGERYVSQMLYVSLLRHLHGIELLVLDGGPCAVGIESTIVDCTRGAPVLLRPGQLARADIERVAGQHLLSKEELLAPDPQAPGTLLAHYAPRAKLRLMDARELRAALDMLGADAKNIAVWARAPLRSASRALLLRRMPDDADAAAQQLFAVLRGFDDAGVKLIWVEPPPPEPAWDGVRDRLQRAAASA